MLLREAEIDGGLFEVAMTEQDLNGAEVSSRLEQVSRKVLMLEASAQCGLLTRWPKHLGGYRMVRRMPPVAGKQTVLSRTREGGEINFGYFTA
jgi:hypothetical protein